jgi:ankyrin repeat protein
MENYEYESINLEDDLSFRLVHLLRGEDGPIQCTLFHANLREVEGLIDYEALSYTWGDPQDQHKIEIDDKEMPVRENLYLALRHLRYTNKERILWIDAICIDQKNRKEQGHQVRQMGSIYKGAKRVIIWLGAATSETDVVLEFLQRLEQESYKYPCNSWKASDGRWHDLWWGLGDEHRRYIAPQRMSSVASVLLATPDQHDGFEDLLCRPWFRRVWIIQEVANAKSARVVCGSKSVSARIFAIMPPLMRVEIGSQCQSILDIMPGSSRKHSWWTRERDLKRLLLQFQGSEASDPRDHIYALLSIASDGYSNNILVPDYNKPLEDVIKDTIAFLLDFPENWRATYQLPDWTLSELYRNLNALHIPILISSIEKGLQATVEMLLCRGDVDVNGHTPQGQRPLWTAVESGSAPIVKLLIDKGAEVNIEGRKYGEMLCEASHKNRVDFVDVPGVSGVTLLSQAIRKGSRETVELLLAVDGVDVNSLDSSGATPLLEAVQSGRRDLVELLLAVDGIDTESPDQSGMTPLSYSALSNEVIFKCLQSLSKNSFQPKSILGAINIRLEHNNVLKARLMDRKGVLQDAKIHLDKIVVEEEFG